MKNKTIFFLTVTVFLLCLTACRKTIRIQPNLSTLVTSQAFASPGQARSVLAAAYFGLINNSTGFASGQITYYTGLSADEFILYDINAQAENEFFQNNIVSTNPLIGVNLWSSCFSTLFIANSTIENIERSEFADSVKNDLIGQARFLRAFCNFYLVNIFGEIPLVTTSNWQKTQLLPRSSVKEVYDLIVSDLLFAEGHLSKAYSANNNERIVANQYAATALLARVYLYLQDWKNAEAAASGLINEKNVFSLEDLNRIYAPDSKEAIWQLKQLNSAVDLFAWPEGTLFIPVVKNSDNPPRVYLYTSFLNSFDTGDKRKSSWIDSTKLTINDQVYYYPYKYKVGMGQTASGYQEYHTVFRLAEQYLIRSEARLEQQNLGGAIDDLNVIRSRAGLLPLPYSLDGTAVKDALVKERRIELFAEWGNRWFDLKRWKKADEILGPLKGNDWQPADALYPIPASEIMADPNLTQNPGY